MMNPKISVIVPVYNVEKYLEKCLNSVVNQKLEDIEIICVNDGSTDNSLNILEKYQKRYNRLKIINKDNGGLSSARNMGIKYATGEYIGFVDSDDWVHEDMFEKLYENGKRYDSDIVMCPINVFDEKLGEIREDLPYFSLNCFSESFFNRTFNHTETKDFLFKISVTAWNKIYKTSFIRKIGAKFPENLIFEDNPFFYEVYLNAEKVSLVPDFLYYYRYNRESSIVVGADDRYFDLTEIHKLNIKIFKNKGLYEEYKASLINHIFRDCINRWNLIHNSYKKEFLEIIKFFLCSHQLKKDFKEIKNELSENQLKKYNNFINSNYKELMLQNIIKSYKNEIIFITHERNNYKKKYIQSIKENNKIKKDVKSISETKPYRFAYFIRRFSIEFFNGNLNNKKSFFEWIFCKITKKENSNHKHNILYKISKYNIILLVISIN